MSNVVFSRVKEKKDYIFLFFFIILSLFSFNLPVFYPSEGLDSSWVIAYHSNDIFQQSFGDGFLFTYGPYGFLNLVSYVSQDLFELGALVHFLVYILLFIAFWIFVRSLNSNRLILFIPLLFTPVINNMSFNWIILIICLINLFLLIWFIPRRTYYHYFLITFCGSLLGLASLIKFDTFINSLSLIGLFSLISFYYKREVKPAILLILIYAFSLSGLWVIANQKIQNIIPYFLDSLEVVKGYPYAMSNGSIWYIPVLSLLIALFIVSIFLYSIFRNGTLVPSFLLLSSVILFTSYKSSVVRQDAGHMFEFLSVCPVILFLIMAVLFGYQVQKKTHEFRIVIILLSSIIAALFIIIVLIYGYSVHSYIQPEQLEKTAILCYEGLYPDNFNNHIYSYKNKIKETTNITGFADFPENSTFHVLPWEYSIIWANDLKWKPCPVFQIYNAYTSTLDMKNAAHYLGNGSDILLYSYATIDGRYPVIDGPQTLLAILLNYKLESVNNNYLILHKKDNQRNEFQTSVVREIKTGFNQWIEVPTSTSPEVITASTDVQSSIWGTIKSLVYRPSNVYIQFKFKNGEETIKYRVFKDSLHSDVIMSDYINDKDDLVDLFYSGETSQKIAAFRLVSDNSIEYSSSFPVTFRAYSLEMGNNDQKRPISLLGMIRNQEKSLDLNLSKILVTDVDGVPTRALFQHSITPASYVNITNLNLTGCTYLTFSEGMDPHVWDPNKGDGVTFQVFIVDNLSTYCVFSDYIDPKHNMTDRKWKTISVDISRYSLCTNATMVLSVGPGDKGDGIYDWAYWINPTVHYS